jgi:carbonic anhydrase/acetyltransferase-like protein (isoleucine patch superfamily)
MPLYPYKNATPTLHPTSYLAPTATLIGAVTLEAEASVWFGAVLRGDVAPVRVGPRTNVQDLCVLHGEADTPTLLGADCTLGHGAIVHGARLGNRVLVGMGAVVLSRATVGDDVIIGAGAVVPEGSTIPAGVLVLGVPGRVVRPLTAEERAHLAASAARYVGYMAAYQAAPNERAISDER